MIRKIIKIDEEKCTGCGICASACHEGAIGIVEGKARLLREDYCDGLGDCLPSCPVNAISFEEREAPAYDKEAVEKEKIKKEKSLKGKIMSLMHKKEAVSSCPGTQSRKIVHEESEETFSPVPGRLGNFPVQIKLVSEVSPIFKDADLLIAADCTAYAYGDFHNRFIKGRTTIIGCPKLDFVDYSEKLTAILKNNSVRSITFTRMQVPCCGGLERAVREAVKASGKNIPLEVFVIDPSGNIL